MTACTFDRAWIGPCGEENCQKHPGLKCSCCGAPATHECAETFGFVCGSPICDDCEHEITEDGVNVATTRHVRKGEQNHLPWCAREVDDDV